MTAKTAVSKSGLEPGLPRSRPAGDATPTRVAVIDAARGVSIILVITGHWLQLRGVPAIFAGVSDTGALTTLAHKFWHVLAHAVAARGVDLFFIISGSRPC